MISCDCLGHFGNFSGIRGNAFGTVRDHLSFSDCSSFSFSQHEGFCVKLGKVLSNSQHEGFCVKLGKKHGSSWHEVFQGDSGVTSG